VIFPFHFLLLSPIFSFWKAVCLLPCTENHTVCTQYVATLHFLNNFVISSIVSTTVFYVHIDIFKNFVHIDIFKNYVHIDMFKNYLNFIRPDVFYFKQSTIFFV